MDSLNQRARRILNAVVQEYLQTGDAVGSRTVTRRYGIDLSAATVRNVMADLEEIGLLTQPHTSAGRVPTDAGLRFFIQTLLKVRHLSPKEKEEIRARYGLPPADLEDALQRSSRLLSELSQQATIVVSPMAERQRLEHMELLRLTGGELLAVLVSAGGQVENRIVKMDVPLDPSFLEKVNNYLHELVHGRTLDEVRAKVLEELGKEKNQLDDLTSKALRLGQAALTATLQAAPDVIVSGQAHLLQGPGETVDVEKMRALLAALEEKERVVQILDRALLADGIQVWLGAETPFAEVADLSVVASSYGPEDRPVGTIAVIGPTRMNYSKVIPLVDFTAELVSSVLDKWR
jgi:heat-inducible transcriptional repressor